jgi:alpha-tubulin suppressor-like RCC1 family protein
MNLRLTAVIALTLFSPCLAFSAGPLSQVVIRKGKGCGPTGWYTDRIDNGGKPVSDAIAISAGRDHALILRADGSVLRCGGNQYGQTNIPGGLKNVVQVAAGMFFSLALDKDGMVSAWGNPRIKSDDVSGVIAISAGVRALALKRDSTVFSWDRYPGSLLKLTNIVAIAAGGGQWERNLALRSDGTVAAWGDEDVPAGLSNAAAIAVGEHHRLALKKDGTVYGWGENLVGQATGMVNPNDPRNANGFVVHSGQVLSNVVAIAAGNEYGLFGIGCHYGLALRNDGTVAGWGAICGQPVTVPEGLSNVVAIAAGQAFCLAITTNAAVAERFKR